MLIFTSFNKKKSPKKLSDFCDYQILILSSGAL